MTRRVTPETIGKIEDWEGVELTAYDDATGRPVQAGQRVYGTLTIGVGHTGPDVRPGMTITRAAAEALLAQDLNKAELAVAGAVKVQLDDRQFGALVSFAFNAGTGAFLGSTLLKKLNAGNYAAVPAELMKWTKTTINGRLVTSPGLVCRRANEAAYWSSATIGDAAVAAQQSAVPAKETGKWFSLESVGGGVAAAGGLGGLSGLVTGNGPFQYALAIIAVLAFGVAAYYFVTRRLATK